ncbi:MAG: DUF2911 domain-containing protein [Saprospiraceae bacterium]|nr:DUF2911 domain-containing protein [Saprospiraceae bacterium]
MKNLFICCMIALTCFSGFSAMAQAIKTPAASPMQTIRQDFALSSIEINYSRPAKKGRVIFGDLVPYGKLWRTGANAVSKIKFGEDVTVGSVAVKAGEYAIYTIPNKDSWEIILNKGLTNWGVDGYKESDDVARFKVKPETSAIAYESFTFLIDGVLSEDSKISMAWDKTMVSFSVKANIQEKIYSQIEEVMTKDKRPYFQSASYYYENDKDLKQALAWTDKAIEQSPDAFWVVHLKAKIQAKMGDKKAAKATAEQSIKLAQKAENQDYVALNLKLIDSL